MRSISLVLVREEDWGSLLIKKGDWKILLELTDPLDREAAIQLLEEAAFMWCSAQSETVIHG